MLPKIAGTAEYGRGHDGPRKMVTVGRGGSECLGFFRREPLALGHRDEDAEFEIMLYM